MPPLNQDPPAITLTHHLMVGYFRRQAVAVAQAVLARQSPGSRPHLMSKTGFAVGAAAVDKPTLLAARAAELSAWRRRDGSAHGSAFRSRLLPAALVSSPEHCLDLGRDVFLQAAAIR